MEHVDAEEAARRAEIAVDVQSDVIDAYNESILGEEREVLCEGFDGPRSPVSSPSITPVRRTVTKSPGSGSSPAENQMRPSISGDSA
mgnify:CR=1 FL=1